MSVLAQLKADIKRISLDGAPFPIALDAELSGDDIVLHVKVRVPDRDTGEPTTVTHMIRIQSYVLERSRRPAMSLLYDAVKTAVLHELDEAWIVDGKRVKDPHANEGP